MLNEPQVNFAGMLCRNNDKTVAFKLTLAKELEKKKEELNTIKLRQQNEQWIETRSQGKLDRRVSTDAIAQFVEYAKSQGSQNAGRYYANISKMENKALFLIEQKYPNLRDVLDLTQLNNLRTADQIVARALAEGMRDRLQYKDIYQLAKVRIESYAGLVGQTQVPKRLKETSVTYLGAIA